MAIQYDRLNEAKTMLKTLRQEFLDEIITAEELAEQTTVIQADIRSILGLPPITPP